jgi:hypothetical protein
MSELVIDEALWADYEAMPPPHGLEIIVEMDDGRLIDAMFVENYYRSSLKMRSTGNMYWLCGLVGTYKAKPKRWRPRLPGEPFHLYPRDDELQEPRKDT